MELVPPMCNVHPSFSLKNLWAKKCALYTAKYGSCVPNSPKLEATTVSGNRGTDNRLPRMTEFHSAAKRNRVLIPVATRKSLKTTALSKTSQTRKNIERLVPSP